MMRKLLHTPVSNQASPSLIFIWTHLWCQANLLIISATKSSCWISAHIHLSLCSQECLSYSLFIKPCPWLLQNIMQIMRSRRRNYRQTSKILVSHASIISAFLTYGYCLFHDCAHNYKDFTTTYAEIWVRSSLEESLYLYSWLAV